MWARAFRALYRQCVSRMARYVPRVQGRPRRPIVKQSGFYFKNDIGVRATRYGRDIRRRGMPRVAITT